jgi:hypothetical protein
VTQGATVTSELETVCFRLFAAGCLVGMIQYPQEQPFGAGYEMVSIAQNLANGVGFANPFEVAETGPTAVNPPLYPMFLALLFKIVPSADWVVVPATVCSIWANALVASWLPRIAMVMFGRIAPGVAASVLWLASMQLMPAWDANVTAAGSVLFWWYSARALQSGWSPENALAAGVIAGGVAILNPSAAVLVILPWLGYLLVSHGRLSSRMSWYAAGVVALMVLPVALWMGRNYAVLGAPVLRTNLGMTLRVSNNECAQVGIAETGLSGCYEKYHPNASAEEAADLRALGEVAYDRKTVADSMEWIRANQRRFGELVIQRWWQFWFPRNTTGPLGPYPIWMGTALSVVGLAWMLKDRNPWVTVILAVLLAYPIMYYAVVSGVRYRYPVLWVSYLAAGYVIRPEWTRRFQRFVAHATDD